MGFWNLFKGNKENDKREDKEFINKNCEENRYCDNEYKDEEENYEIKENYECEFRLLDNNDIKDSMEYEIELSEDEIDELITGEIIKVIEGKQNFEALKKSSEEAAKRIGDKYIDLLPGYIASKVSRPRSLRTKYDALGEWQMVVENAVLMILFSYKEKGVKYLVKIVSSNRNLRLKSINLLCKLAAEGILPDEIINTVMNNLPYFDDEDKIVIFGFMSQIKGNKQVIALIQHFYKRFVKEGDVVKGYQSLVYLINVAEKFTKGHLNFLKSMALGKNSINLEGIMRVEEEDGKTIQIDDIEEIYKVRAAITYYSLDKNDDDINSKLYYWSEYSLDNNVRKETKDIINTK